MIAAGAMIATGMAATTVGAQAAEATPARPLAASTLATLTVTATQEDAPGYTQDSFKYPRHRADLGSKADQWDWVYQRDFAKDTIRTDHGNVVHGELHDDPYSGQTIVYEGKAGAVDIEHVVARSEAWDSGASKWTQEKRDEFANDPLETMAVSASGNRSHGEKDAAKWLPSSGSPLFPKGNPSYDCKYVARQIAVKAKYKLTVDKAEHDAMAKTLAACPTQTIPLDTDGEYWADNTADKPVTGGASTDKPSTDKPSTGDKTKYGLEDIRYIGFGDDTSIAGDWRSDRLEFDAEHAIHIDRATVPSGWKLEETGRPARAGRMEYTTVATLTSPDGSYTKTYELYSTPFLKTSMTVAGRTPENGRVTLDRDAFDGLDATGLKTAVVPAPADCAVTESPSVTANGDGSKTARIDFLCGKATVWTLQTRVTAADAATGKTDADGGDAAGTTDTSGTRAGTDPGTPSPTEGALASTGATGSPAMALLPAVLIPLAMGATCRIRRRIR